MSLIPLPYRILAILALLAGLFGSGYYEGHKQGKASGEADLAAFRASVEVAAAKQAAATQATIAKQEQVNESVASDYQQKLAAIRTQYSSVQHVDIGPGGRPIAALSCPSGRIDGTAADLVPAPAVEAVSKADFDQLSGLAAQTTQQLLSLQSWVLEQEGAFP